MKYAITVVTPEGYVHSLAFHEMAETLHYALLALGHDSMITAEGDLPGRQHIVLGANLLTEHPMALARDAILYNLEQAEAGPWFDADLITTFRACRVWDYSDGNTEVLEALGVMVEQVLPIGYMPELTRLEHAGQPDIDVLFVGSMNARRRKVLDGLRAAGLRTVALFGVYGAKRDSFIERAKVVLNVHFYDAKVLEMVRLSYLLSNRCVVLSERSTHAAEDQELAGGVEFADYQDLVARAGELVADAPRRSGVAARGFEIMRARSEVEFLRVALES
jgi:hypothetical protein